MQSQYNQVNDWLTDVQIKLQQVASAMQKPLSVRDSYCSLIVHSCLHCSKHTQYKASLTQSLLFVA